MAQDEPSCMPRVLSPEEFGKRCGIGGGLTASCARTWSMGGRLELRTSRQRAGAAMVRVQYLQAAAIFEGIVMSRSFQAQSGPSDP